LKIRHIQTAFGSDRWYHQPVAKFSRRRRMQISLNHDALNALAEFKEYAGGTLLVLDLMGTFVFALSGAGAAIREKLDLFGVLVVSFAAASAGGITRDLLIGATPPAAI